jgi:hypothetical protein
MEMSVNMNVEDSRTPEQIEALNQALQRGKCYDLAVSRRGYSKDITISNKEKAKRRAKAKAAKQSRKKNR